MAKQRRMTSFNCSTELGKRKGWRIHLYSFNSKENQLESTRIRFAKNIHCFHLEVPHFSEFAKTPKADAVQQEVIVLTLTSTNDEPGVWLVSPLPLCFLLPLGDTVDNQTYAIHKRW